MLFIIVGVGLLRSIFEQNKDAIFGIMIIVLGWYLLCFIAIITCLKEDFNIKFERLTNIGKKIKKSIRCSLKYIFLIAFTFAMLICFYAAYDVFIDTKNILQIIMLIIVGLIFGSMGYFFYRILGIFSLEKSLKKNNIKK